ncbi:MAG: SDR family NAD(P)-dependent oxidoreductase [Pseudomonadota bacterium]
MAPRPFDCAGAWALITGGSSGIGAAFAAAYAARGANVILTGRDPARLQSTATDLERDFAVKTALVPADLAAPGAPQAIWERVRAAGLEVDILVNNAGYAVPGAFVDHPWSTHQAFIEVMVTSYVRLAHLAAPGMVARARGQIIQNASLAGLLPGAAGHTLYAPSKAFLITFAEGLFAELRGSGVAVCAVCPGLTRTPFHERTGAEGFVAKLPGALVSDPGAVAEASLAGLEAGRVIVTPGRVNAFAAALARFMPRSWARATFSGAARRLRGRRGGRDRSDAAQGASLSDQS